MYQYQRFKAMDIKRTIKANGLTVKEVAEKMGITPVGLSQHINGNPSVEVLERIAAAIGCNVGDFFAPQPTNTITCPHCGKLIKVEKGDSTGTGVSSSSVSSFRQPTSYISTL